MKRLMIAGLILLQACSSSDNYVKERFAETTPEGVSTAVAHRGCWLREPDGEYYIPENSTYGIEMAARYGYPAIELDVKYTLDNVMVVMHDGTINRTMRNASDYSKIEKPVRVSDMLFEDLRRDYVLESSDPAKRTPIPTLKEMLLACKKTGIIPMLHSKVLESYELAHKILGDKWIAFDGNYPSMKYARSVSDCLVLWDPDRLTAEETIAKLQEIGGWCGMSTMKYDMQDAAYIAAMQAGGCVTQSSIFPTPYEQKALHDGTDIELSDFFWFQTIGREPVASVCETLELKAGETWQSPAVEVGDFAAMTVQLEFCGSLELQVDDRSTRVYPLHRDTVGEEAVGLRLYKVAPSFRIVAAEDIVVKVNASIYDIKKEPMPLKSVIEVEGRQGVACDGEYYYVSGSTALYKYSLKGELLLTNSTPFESITAGSPAPNHIGDIDVFEGEIYAGCEYFMDGVGQNIQIAIYDANTLQYKRSLVWEPTSGQVECCGLTVDRARKLVWMADWVNGSHIYCYDNASGQYLGKVALDPAPGLQQGIYCRADGSILISSDDGDAEKDEADHLYICNPYKDGSNMLKEKADVQVFMTMESFRRAGEIEGLCINDATGELIVLSNRGARIILGMPSGFYEGYDHEIHELYIY